MCHREKGFVLWGHCQNLLDDPRSNYKSVCDVTHNTGVTFTFWTPYVSFCVHYTDTMQKKQQVLYTTVNIELCALIQVAYNPNVISDRRPKN